MHFFRWCELAIKLTPGPQEKLRKLALAPWQAHVSVQMCDADFGKVGCHGDHLSTPQWTRLEQLPRLQIKHYLDLTALAIVKYAPHACPSKVCTMYIFTWVLVMMVTLHSRSLSEILLKNLQFDRNCSFLCNRPYQQLVQREADDSKDEPVSEQQQTTKHGVYAANINGYEIQSASSHWLKQ